MNEKKFVVKLTQDDLQNSNVIGDFVNTITERVVETHDEFIFESIKPFCENVVQRKISKHDLEQALLKYYGSMRISINIPKEFKWHYNNDKFVDSLERIRVDIKNSDGISGNYEYELIEMLIEAFKNSRVKED